MITSPSVPVAFHVGTHWTATIPLTLPSVANLREHWANRAKRTKAQRAAVSLLCGRELRRLSDPRAHYVITMTRVAPRSLDSDNLSSSLKAARDEVAKHLGFFNDSDSRLSWLYAQSKGEAALEISVEQLFYGDGP